MAKSNEQVTPDNRLERWKKLWATPRRMSEEETDLVFDEFADAFVPSHMHKLFLKAFGSTKSQINNRCFKDDVTFQDWGSTFSTLLGSGGHVEVAVLYGGTDHLEGHFLRGERRRTLRDVFIDDWYEACAIVRGGRYTLYAFIGRKMRGCVVRTVVNEGYVEEAPEEE